MWTNAKRYHVPVWPQTVAQAHARFSAAVVREWESTEADFLSNPDGAGDCPSKHRENVFDVSYASALFRYVVARVRFSPDGGPSVGFFEVEASVVASLLKPDYAIKRAAEVLPGLVGHALPAPLAALFVQMPDGRGPVHRLTWGADALVEPK